MEKETQNGHHLETILNNALPTSFKELGVNLSLLGSEFVNLIIKFPIETSIEQMKSISHSIISFFESSELKGSFSTYKYVNQA
ncbi:hypothetical protein [Rhizosphaericola mali]|uniref:Uncharacterized protein n=1 Tax=Rhizosphaericola mali TaxID=2545455 RepID=A0A5P2G078_9BACT|nr:hypothetical protein [Rhizosphaericola mali]QES87200.1 hypothetical protein E0W69_000475 [Rhizosphaericola mali]